MNSCGNTLVLFLEKFFDIFYLNNKMYFEVWLKCQNSSGIEKQAMKHPLWSSIVKSSSRTHKAQRHLSGKQDFCLRECTEFIQIHRPLARGRDWPDLSRSSALQKLLKLHKTLSTPFSLASSVTVSSSSPLNHTTRDDDLTAVLLLARLLCCFRSELKRSSLLGF